MIELPRKLHNLHHFKRNDEPFVADLDAGVVLPVNEVISDVLNACETEETDTLLETLADKHGSRAEVIDALMLLSKLSEVGVLFSSDTSDVEPSHLKNRLKIYVTPGVVESRDRTPFLVSTANHHLITVLAKHADVYVGLSESDFNRQAIEESLRTEGVHPVFFRSNRSFSPAKFIPTDCDGILALSPLTEGEQVFLKFNTIPVVLRLSNAALISSTARNRVLERCAALRDFDAIACDASWTQTFFSEVVAEMRPFHHIPYGVDTSVFKPMEKTACKHQLSQALGDTTILQKPLVGVVTGFQPHETSRFMRKLHAANPHFNYLVIHSSVTDDFESEGYVHFFNIASLQDKEASPFIFNALDALVFPTLLGTSPQLLLEIVACGIPTIGWGDSIPKELSGAGFGFVQVSQSLFDPVELPHEAISQHLKSLLENPDAQKRIGQQGVEAVSTYTWDAALQGILTLFRDLRHQRARPPKQRNQKLLFRKHYNGVSGEIESDALVQSKLQTPIDVEQAIAMTLLEEQTPIEVKTVLGSICRDPDRVENILKNLI